MCRIIYKYLNTPRSCPKSDSAAICHKLLHVYLQINAAVDEMAVHAEANCRLMSMRSSNQKLSQGERKKATELFHYIAVSIPSQVDQL